MSTPAALIYLGSWFMMEPGIWQISPEALTMLIHFLIQYYFFSRTWISPDIYYFFWHTQAWCKISCTMLFIYITFMCFNNLFQVSWQKKIKYFSVHHSLRATHLYSSILEFEEQVVLHPCSQQQQTTSPTCLNLHWQVEVGDILEDL